VESGLYTIAMRPAGAAASTPAVISTSVRATAGSAHTIAGVGRYSSLGLTVLDDDLTPPPSGRARVRVIQASARQPQLDVSVLGGPTVATGVRFATTTGYRTVKAGSWKLRLTGPGGRSTTTPCTLAAAGVYSVIVLDGANGAAALRAVVRTDAQGSSVVPDKAIDAGFGGAAPRMAAGSVGGVVGGVVGVLLAVGGVRWGRRRSVGRHSAR
jgi:hypothetical protein